MIERTTKEHRAEVEVWRASAPKNDHEIFGRKVKAEKPRHRDLSELSALLAMRSRPIGVAEGVDVTVEPTSPIATNWRLVPANDNELPHEDAGVERVVEVIPSVDMIMREVWEDDIEYGLHIDENGKRHKVITRIGKLRFSDGSQTEKGQKLVLDKVVDADIKMPVGAMLGCREKSARDKGAEIDTTGSNAYYRWMVKGRVATPPKLTPKKGERFAISKAEARKILADAYANTPVLPQTKVCPDGLPYAPSNLRQLFIGGRKGKKGESGSQAWQDIYTQKENRETFNRGLDAMQDAHVRVLNEAMTAKSLSELGEARGYCGRHAVDAGRRLLRAANDNFQEAMKLAKYAAEG
ncbi:hypothetical protein [Rhizobium rhizogenes]|uniref:Uncharacterized protein n=1 Tax=Rhizobium rhizogenes NBRC 13257 TaxID=1220581 RepID=A0AA87Q0M2_RHIRH|nr:hypothetical protein [Rhizobium rhizogenes]GAJ91025.1 hypothetical protein RRH01S_01_04940 [Rhizobium rhizogenes NBRC 13257]